MVVGTVPGLETDEEVKTVDNNNGDEDEVVVVRQQQQQQQTSEQQQHDGGKVELTVNDDQRDENLDDDSNDRDQYTEESVVDKPEEPALESIPESNQKLGPTDEAYDEPLLLLDERTYLDIFGESAKDFLTKKIIPTTDLSCKWNWKHIRCEPRCSCSFQPRLGDFHLGRSCRLRLTNYDDDESCDDDEFENYQQKISTVMKKATLQLQQKVSKRWNSVYGSIQNQVCKDLHSRCNPEQHGRNRVSGKQQEEFAWQEKLFCREYINECT
jgi:hypothetical protein